MEQNIIGTIVVVAVIILLVIVRNKRVKDSAWKGELIKKRDISDEDNENHIYKLIFKTDAGKKEKLTVSEVIYQEAKIGDRYEKVAGDNTPKKI